MSRSIIYVRSFTFHPFLNAQTSSVRSEFYRYSCSICPKSCRPVHVRFVLWSILVSGDGNAESSTLFIQSEDVPTTNGFATRINLYVCLVMDWAVLSTCMVFPIPHCIPPFSIREHPTFYFTYAHPYLA